jgi:hypothetical protein
LRYLVHWDLRRDDLCDPNLCEHAAGECPRERLQAAKSSGNGQLLRRALDLRALIKIGLNLTLDDIDGDEMLAMLIVEEEQRRHEDEKLEAEKNRI